MAIKSPRPRAVGIKIKIKDHGFGGWTVRENTPPPPVALQVCRESREEALKRYVLSFGTTVHPPTVYFNYQIDTLCFGDGVPDGTRGDLGRGASDYLLNLWHGRSYMHFVNKSRVVETHTVRRMTLDVDEDIFGRSSFCWEEIRRFRGLETLCLVVWDEEDRRDELVDYFGTAMMQVKGKNPDWVAPRVEVVSADGRSWGNLNPGHDTHQ
ncbi:hypothetical protein D0Z07_2800 [Hyphodiscus hymeniophilus]|uniref:2EXR domain-containing protein n=1 Tax=Hyphodiscus hymeniophilus TaxID=353542 RepID=A0A9P7AZC0_9HELO|nr:hypothetical protein D0Z07_2800 [Hyphodiscus hymeniophilus]